MPKDYPRVNRKKWTMTFMAGREPITVEGVMWAALVDDQMPMTVRVFDCRSGNIECSGIYAGVLSVALDDPYVPSPKK